MMFFARRDGKTVRNAVRRVKSPRASVYLEFAVVMPLVAMIIAFIFEFISLWDARIMANHTAWVCGRIASAQIGVGAFKDYANAPTKNRLLTEDMKTATMFLMSTCALGGVGAQAGMASGYDSTGIDTVVKDSFEDLRACFTIKWEEVVSHITGQVIPNSSDTGLIGTLKRAIVAKLNEFLLGVIKPVTDLIDKIKDEVLFDSVKINELNSALSDDAHLRQFGAAKSRLDTFGDRIFAIRERDDDQWYFGQNSGLTIEFPRHVGGLKESDRDNDWMVKSDKNWPPNDQHQRMIDVKIYWPLERAWLWRAIVPVKNAAVAASAEGAASAQASAVAAVGRSISYPQPLIANANLDSENPTPFEDGALSAAELLSDLQAEYEDFLKVVWFWYTYRLREELVGELFLQRGAGKYGYNDPDYHFIQGPENKKNPDGWYQNAKWNFGINANRVTADGLWNWMTGVMDTQLVSKYLEGGKNAEADLRDGIGRRWEDDSVGRKYRTESYLVSHRNFYTSTEYESDKDVKSKATETWEFRDKWLCYFYGYEGNPKRYREMDWFYWHIDNDKAEQRYRFEHWTAEEMTNNYFRAQEHGYYSIKNHSGIDCRTPSAYAFMASNHEEAYLSSADGTVKSKVTEKIKECVRGSSNYKQWLTNNSEFDSSSLDAFAHAAYDYYCGTMLQDSAYRISAQMLIRRTFPLTGSDLNTKEIKTFEGFLGLATEEGEEKDLIRECGNELGKSLGLVDSGFSEEKEMDIDLAPASPLSDPSLQDPKLLQDPDALRKKADELLNARKKIIFEGVHKVDAAETNLIGMAGEKRFCALRDERLNVLYTWIAQEIIVRYGAHIGWVYDGYKLSFLSLSRSVSQDKAFLSQLEGFRALWSEWGDKLKKLREADIELGKLLGLKAAAEAEEYVPGNITPDKADELVDPDPEDPGGAGATSGSKDDKRGEEWFHDVNSKRWVPGKMYW